MVEKRVKKEEKTQMKATLTARDKTVTARAKANSVAAVKGPIEKTVKCKGQALPQRVHFWFRERQRKH